MPNKIESNYQIAISIAVIITAGGAVISIHNTTISVLLFQTGILLMFAIYFSHMINTSGE